MQLLIRLLICASQGFWLSGCLNHAVPNQIPVNFKPLSGAQIKQAFYDVRDQAQVQDSLNTTANNQWHSDGKFISVWSNSQESGTVTGKWFVTENARCVVIESGLPTMVNQTKCGPIYRHNEKYYTVNEDGSIHGIHTVTKLAQEIN